jgi:transcriptional regulator with XRE-family HTH domain
MSKRADQGGWPPTGFGKRLKALREAQGLTQDELAASAGCNKFTISKLERGLQEPAWPLVLALARVLGVKVGEFVAPDKPQSRRKMSEVIGEIMASLQARPEPAKTEGPCPPGGG